MTRLPYYLLCLAVLCYAWAVLALQHYDLLWQIQNFSDLPDPEASLGSLLTSHPGALREWAGDWLTQLFGLPRLGATVMVAMWGLSAVALIRAFRLERGWMLAALVPVLALLASMTQLGYWIYCLKAPSYWFGPTLGLLTVSLWLWGFSRIKRKWQSWAVCCWIGLGYVCLGWYATLGALVAATAYRVTFMMDDSWSPTEKHEMGGAELMGWLLTLLTIYPGLWMLYRHHAATHWRESLEWYGFHHLTNPEAEAPLLEACFWVMAVGLVLLPVLGAVQQGQHARYLRALASRKASVRLQAKESRAHLLGIVLAAVALAGANMLNYRNANFQTELRMLRQLEEGRWEEMLAEMKGLERRPTREMVLMKDVALTQLGRLGDEAFTYDCRGVRPQMNIDLPIHMNHSAGPLIYYWLGLPNYAFMWCQEDQIEYGLSPFFLKLMYRSARANGEEEAARKFEARLRRSLCYRDYTVKDGELRQVRRLMTGHDELTNDRGYCEIYLLQRLSHEQYDTAEAQQLAVHEAMLMRDRDAFSVALDRYRMLSGDSLPLPRHFEEARMYYEMTAPSPRYEGYLAMLNGLRAQGLSREAIGERMRKDYGNTYWWYYDFYTDNKSY